MWGFFIFNSEIFLYIYNMGCDIHMFAERYSTENNRWEKVGNEFIDFYATMTIPVDINKSIGVPLDTSKDILEKYLKSEEPIGKVEKFIFQYLDENLPDKDEKISWVDYITNDRLPNIYCDKPYSGRNYDLFYVLAGVRGDKLGQIIHPPKGIPDDATQEIREPYEEWGSDAHSASYYYLSELLECDYGKMNKSELEKNRLDYFFYDVLNRCKEISDDTNKFRIIFWFDN